MINVGILFFEKYNLARAKRSVLCFVTLAKPLIEFGTKAYYSNLILLESMVPCNNGLLIISKTENKMLSFQGSHLTSFIKAGVPQGSIISTFVVLSDH